MGAVVETQAPYHTLQMLDSEAKRGYYVGHDGCCVQVCPFSSTGVVPAIPS